MDKRQRSAGHPHSEGSSRDRNRSKAPPRRIASGEDFLDASRDPRLNNVKYRAHMMTNKSRVSPDTTMATKKGSNKMSSESDKNSENVSMGKVDRDACFACGLCTDQSFVRIEQVRLHVEEEHSIAKEIVDKLIKLPSTESLKSYRCVACPAGTASAFFLTSDADLKSHFKIKHKINNIKPFLVKRICRICEKDNFSSNDDLMSHIKNDHPRSDFYEEEEEEEAENGDDDNDEEYEPQDFEERKVSHRDDYLSKDEEEELNYEPKSPSPPPPPPPSMPPKASSSSHYEASSIPEDGELSENEMKKSRSRKRSRSDSSSSDSSEDRVKIKPRQYRDSSSSSSDSRVKRSRQRSASPPPRASSYDSKRKVYVKGGGNGNQNRGYQQPPRSDDSFFGVTYIPPAGYCEECEQRYESGQRAQDHFNSKRHYYSVKNKYRCYFCNAYVQDTKGHLESRHRDMTFQCQLNGCANPRFTQANKVIDHVRCNHPNQFGKTRRDMDLFKKRMISMPKNIMSFTCRQCKVVFHGDVKIAIVHLVIEHGQNIPRRNDFIFSCRICGPKAHFDNEKQLESHCAMHVDEVFGDGNNSRRNSRSPSSDRSSRSRSRSRSPRRSPDRSPPPYRRQQQGPNNHALSCHFCPDQFRTLAVRKQHMLRDHEGLLFQCALCTFHNMYRRDMTWHLKEHHKKKGYPDEALIKDFVHWPKDLRKIICGKCSETEAHERAVWMAVDPQEDITSITKEMKAHASMRHGIEGKDVDSCFKLMCIGCNAKFELDNEIKEWDEHMDRQPCRAGRRGYQSRSRSRSRSPKRAPGSPRVKSEPVEIDLEKHCMFCCKQLESKSQMDEHVRQRHLEMAFVCRLCDTGSLHYEPDLPSIKDHLREDHGKDDDDLDDENVKDFTRYPKSLICIKCNLCGLLCHGQREEDLELHFKIFHDDSTFSTQHLDYICRICMISGQHDSLKELKDHMYDTHPDDVK